MLTKERLIIDDTFSSEKVNNDAFEDVSLEILDKTIHDTVYTNLNNAVLDKIEEHKYIAKVKGARYFAKTETILTQDYVRNIYDRILSSLPTAIEKVGKVKFELALFHYINRFLYDYFYYVLNSVDPEKAQQQVKNYFKFFSLNNTYKYIFPVCYTLRSYLFQQALNLFVYNRKKYENIISLFETYTTVDEDELIMVCVTTYIANMSLKQNPLKIKNLNAFIKASYRKVLNYVLTRSLTLEDSDDEIDTSFLVTSSESEIELSANAQVRYRFLINMLRMIKNRIDNFNVNICNTPQKILFRTIKDNYNFFNSTTTNIFRLLYVLMNNDSFPNYDLYVYLYDDYIDLLKFFYDSKFKTEARNEYPELFPFIRAIAVVNNRSRSIIPFSRRGFNEYLKSDLNLRYNLQSDFTEIISNEISRKIYEYFQSVIFVNPLTGAPISKVNIDKLYSDITKLIGKYLFE